MLINMHSIQVDGEKELLEREELMEEEILLGKLPVLGTQGEVFRNGLCASPDGSHHSVCTAGYPDPLQFCIAVENMQRRDLQYDEDRE